VLPRFRFAAGDIRLVMPVMAFVLMAVVPVVLLMFMMMM
jgi:hypothetical protein